MDKVNIDDLIAEVVKLSKEYPDCRSDFPCSYESGDYGYGMKGCIFGNALRRLGIYDKLDNSHISRLDGGPTTPKIRIILEKMGYTDPQKDCRIRWCSEVQAMQDSRQSWKKAVDSANEFYPEVVK